MSDGLTISVIVGTRTDVHSLRSQVGMIAESDCLSGQFERILRISDSEAGVKVDKSGGAVEGEGRCGLIIFSAKFHRKIAHILAIFCVALQVVCFPAR